jgi:hypothetical protein
MSEAIFWIIFICVTIWATTGLIAKIESEMEIDPYQLY